MLNGKEGKGKDPVVVLERWASACRYYAKRAEGDEKRAEYRGEYRAYERAAILLKTGQ